MKIISITTLIALCNCLLLVAMPETVAAPPGKVADLTYTQLARKILYPILLPEHTLQLRINTRGSKAIAFYGDDFKHPSGYVHEVTCPKTGRFSLSAHAGEILVGECQKQRPIIAQYAKQSRAKLDAYLATMPKRFDPNKLKLRQMYEHKTLKPDVDLYYFPIFLAGRGGFALIYSAVVVSPRTAIVVQMVSERCAQSGSKLGICSDTQARLSKIAYSVYQRTQATHEGKTLVGN